MIAKHYLHAIQMHCRNVSKAVSFSRCEIHPQFDLPWIGAHAEDSNTDIWSWNSSLSLMFCKVFSINSMAVVVGPEPSESAGQPANLCTYNLRKAKTLLRIMFHRQ